LFLVLSGERTYNQILQLVATTIVLMSMAKLLIPDLFPMNLRISLVAISALTSKIQEQVEKWSLLEVDPRGHVQGALSYCSQINAGHPLVYSALELGHSWEEVVGRMLGLHDVNRSPVGA
jgi:hypothetical protein